MYGFNSFDSDWIQISALDLHGNNRITDSGIIEIVKSCGSSLKRLYLHNCVLVSIWLRLFVHLFKLTDASVDSISNECSCLEYFDIYGCDLVTIDSIKRLLKKHHQTLKELNIKDGLRDEAIQYTKDEKLKQWRELKITSSKIKLW